jgi:hypothetical protein
MSNFIFPEAKTAMLQGSVNLIDEVVYAVLIKGDSIIPVSEPRPLVGKMLSQGVFSASNVTFSNMEIGETAKAVLIYTDTVRLAYIDSANYGLPVVGNGGYVSILWNDGPNKIFKL